MPKTGSTSIQLSLSQSRFNRQFQLITLDSFFGNQTMLAAFRPIPTDGSSVFFPRMKPKQAQSFGNRARNYLSRCLRRANRLGIVPILSSETVFRYSESALQSILQFLQSHGFQPTVHIYLRAPLDQIEASFQQQVKTDRPSVWEALSNRLQACGDLEAIQKFDRAFGLDHVKLSLFDASEFPGNCVVQHFCKTHRINFQNNRIHRVNESLNSNAVKFLFAFSTVYVNLKNKRTILGDRSCRFRRDLLHLLLQAAPGSALRFHPSLTMQYRESAKSQAAIIEKRLGKPFPLTLVDRSIEEGIRSRNDLFCYQDEALEWLGQLANQRPVRNGQGQDTVQGVAKQIASLTIHGNPRASLSILQHELWLRIRRNLHKATTYL